MSTVTYAVYIFYPYTMTYVKTPFEGDREEMLEVAAELQDRALRFEERGMYIVRPLPKTGADG
ncbi:hypothetical protein [Rubrobacter indicoceani]|uniref:hypothetical protein n=1 Tax=Rubrobacter indicoceani TaxID=2051957 RepID=UPI0013C4A526|nr:hypothetical protein [Rubrobacter indicoceani]